MSLIPVCEELSCVEPSIASKQQWHSEKEHMDASALHRPISNPLFIDKVIEKVVFILITNLPQNKWLHFLFKTKKRFGPLIRIMMCDEYNPDSLHCLPLEPAAHRYQICTTCSFYLLRWYYLPPSFKYLHFQCTFIHILCILFFFFTFYYFNVSWLLKCLILFLEIEWTLCMRINCSHFFFKCRGCYGLVSGR